MTTRHEMKEAGLTPQQRRLLRRSERVEKLLDDAIRIPVVGVRVGLDSLAGLIPLVGDALGTVLSSYLIWLGLRLGVPPRKLLRMAGNLVLDAIVGSLPVIGDVADVLFKANRRNLRIIRRHLGVS